MIPWAHRFVVLWGCGFSHGHAVVFLFPDNEATLMAIEISDTVMMTYRSLGSLYLASSDEVGTAVPSRGLNGHVVEGYVVAHI